MSLWERIKAVFRFILKMDLLLLSLIIPLLIFSVFVIYNIGVQAEGSLENYWWKQVIWICGGFVLMVIIAYIDYDWIGQNSWMVYLGGLILLSFVFIPGLGWEVNGARSWIKLPGFTIQPSEIAKPCTITALAWYASRKRVLLNQLTNIIPVVLLTAGPMALIALQPDDGSMLVFIPILATVLFVAGCKIRYLSYPLILGLILTPIIFLSLSNYQKNRIYVITDQYVLPKVIEYSTQIAKENNLPENKVARIEKMSHPWFYTKTEIAYQNKELTEDEYKKITKSGKYLTNTQFKQDSGWQTFQSSLAVGSGGKYGKGWGNGTQIILGFLPSKITPTDCIFSIICEEGGFISAIIVLFMLLGIILCTIRTACLARDLFGRVLVITIGMLFLFHTFINVGMAIGFVPVIGIPLPFVSYGGSFIISTMMCVGLLQSVYIRREVTASEQRLSDLV